MTDENELILAATVGASAAVAKEAYNDLLHPAAQELGQSLGYVARFVKTVFKGFEVAADHIDKQCDKFIAKVEETVESIPPERRIEPSLGVFQSIVSGSWGALDSDLMQELFLNLLKSAIDKTTASRAFPNYGEIIKQLTPDEALLLVFFKKYPEFHPIINIVEKKPNPSKAYRIVKEKITLLPQHVNIKYQQNIPIYLENLSRLGIISITFTKTVLDLNLYKQLEQTPESINTINTIKLTPNTQCGIERGIFNLTNFGKSFCDICISDKTVESFL